MKPLLFSLCFAGLVHAAEPAATPARPNILWLTSEDHGPEMGCYGDPLARTPNIDALAARGLRFRFAWSNHPVCAPARTAIITGQHSESSGGLHMRSQVPLGANVRLFPEFLRAAGYYCTNNVKEDYNVPKTAATWGESSRDAHWNKRAADQPFFAVFNSTKSHESQLRAKLATQPGSLVTDPARVRVPAYHPDTPAVRQDWARYYDIVSEADADAGARLRELAAAGLADDTIIFYYGDHGSGMPRGKRWPGHSGLAVALVVYFPEKWHHLAPAGYAPGAVSDRLVSFVDLAPTVLSLAGLTPPAWMQGRAFAGAHPAPAGAYLFGARGRMDECADTARSVTDGRYVYIRNYQPHLSAGQHIAFQFETPTTRVWRERFDAGRTDAAQSAFWQAPRPAEELYDLATDRDEVNNLAASPGHQSELARLRAALRDHQLAVGDIAMLPEGAMRARLAAGDRPARELLLRVLDAADRASRPAPDSAVALAGLLADPDEAVRWWAALGHLIQGRAIVAANAAPLRAALADASPEVRVAAAEALATHGSDTDRAAALATLRELASPAANGFFAAHAALSALDHLGARAGELRAWAAALTPECSLPDIRYDTYLVRLLEKLRQPIPPQ